MLLKRLELNGFKSFAGKTVLDFPKGVTAIVGPNGSGKSNVIDAIRWLLGERDSKSLRGGKVTDLIFGGTVGKAKVGVATSSLVFNNTSRFFPIDFDEVEVRRQVGRDGNSSYWLNKSEVRLKDLVEMMAQSRLGTKGLIVISQGNSDLFIKATPQERREMIEEILGLREFRIKRQEAERKLKNTGFNIEKVSAQVAEIAPHLKFLKKQAAKWEKRAELVAELEMLENDFYSSQARTLQDGYLAADPVIEGLKKEIETGRRELEELEEKLQKVERSEPEQRERFTKVRQEKAEKLRKKNDLERRSGALEAEIGAVKRLAAQSESTSVDAGELAEFLKNFYKKAEAVLKGDFELDKARTLLEELVERGKKVFSGRRGSGENEIQKLEKEQAGLALEMENLDRALERLEKEEIGLEKELQSFTSNFKQAITQVEEKRNELAEVERKLEQEQLEKDRWGFKMEELKEKIRQTGRQWEEFLKVKASSFSEAERQKMEGRIFRLRGELSAIGDIDESLVKEHQETEERYNFLEGQLADLAKASEDLGGIVTELSGKIADEFGEALKLINKEFDEFFKVMFKGGKAELKVEKPKAAKLAEDEGVEMEAPEEKKEMEAGVVVNLSLPKKKVSGLDVLSGGERSLVSIAALFALISVSPPPFLVMDEVDAPLDERNAGRFAEMIRKFSDRVQFVVVTHNRATMEAADVLYGVTLGEDGASRVVSLKMS